MRRRTCSRRGKRNVCSVMLSLLSLLVASCASDVSPAPARHICEVKDSSQEGEVLQRMIGADGFDTQWFKTTTDFSKQLRKDLQQKGSKRSTLPVDVCFFSSRSGTDVKSVHVSFFWSASGGPAKGRLHADEWTEYRVGGVLAESTGIIAELATECRISGSLAADSRQVLLRGRLASPVSDGKRPEAGTKERQAAFLYAMAQRATEALGCENKPLQGAPVVKPGKG